MQKVISILLTFLMLASSSGVTYAKHFCGNQEILSVITLGEKDLTCDMVLNIDNCYGKEKQEDNYCCKNKYENVDTDDNYDKTSFSFSLNIPFIASFVSTFILNQAVSIPQLVHFYSDYNPLSLDKDILVLYQTFLI